MRLCDIAKLTDEERRQHEAELENEIFEAVSLEFDSLVMDGLKKFWEES